MDDPGEWSPADEQALFRVAQEALANVMRHSQTTGPELWLDWSPLKTEPISAFLVDDHSLVRKGVRASLEARQDFVVVGEAESGEEAVRQITSLVPDVVLMDLRMEGIDGVEATRHIKRLSRRSQVVLTSYHDDEHIFPARGPARFPTC